MTDDDYTPSTLSVRIAYTYIGEERNKEIERRREEAFDRWLQGVINAAFNEGYGAAHG